MESEIRYIKPNEEYRIRRRESIPLVRRVSLWLLVPLILLASLGNYCLIKGVGIETVGQTTYQVEGDVDYQVYLKENEYYSEQFLGPNRQYIASIINNIRAEFDYRLEADEKINANYEYEITATAIATDRNDIKQVLYEQSDTLKTGKITPIENGSVAIREDVNIDYDKYNEYMRGFRSDFGIVANCYLLVELVVKVDGAIKTEDTLAMNIPLSDQTINIDISAEEITREDKVGDAKEELYIRDLPVAVIGGVIVFTSVLSSAILIYLYVTRFGNNWYAEVEYKIKKKYDTLIVDATNSYHEDGELVRVGEFIELIDASRAEGTPIVRYDVDPEYKSYYVVSSSNGLKTYRYTLSREHQDKLRINKLGKEKI